MKKMIKNAILFLFKAMTSFYLSKNRIEVVAITGSAGKTTTKFALAKLLDDKDVYVPKEAYNTEIGIPLSVFGQKIPQRLENIGGWFVIILKMFLKLFQKPKYRTIVLELGADKPGDISYLTSFITPTIGIVTSVLMVHTEAFKTLNAVAAEKGELVKAVPANGTVILNYDDEMIRKMAGLAQAHVIWIGKNKKADLRYDDLCVTRGGLSFTLYYREKKYQAQSKILAPQLLPSILAAIAAGLAMGKNIDSLILNIKEIEAQPGRMNMLTGIRDITIIDDSYNANPESMLAALDILKGFEGRKIAVLGGMNELGDYEKPGHEMVAKKAAEVADSIVVIGRKGRQFYLPILEKLQKEAVEYFETPYQAGDYLATEVKKGDNVLVKGSQNGVYAEEALKKILPKGLNTDEILVRQSVFWEKEKEKNFK